MPGGSASAHASAVGALAVLPGKVLAHLQAPSIGLDQYVVEGTTVDDLREGPGHYAGTPLPGQPGNVAIAGHRTTYGAPFNRLGSLSVGDQIALTTRSGSFRYVVARQPYSVQPSDTGVVRDFGDDRLTLTTCTPEFSATRRLIVVAMLRPSPGTGSAPLPSPLRAASPTTAPPEGDFKAWAPAAMPGAMLGLAFVVLLGLARGPAVRALGRAGALVLLTPAWLCALLFLFEHLSRVLPASV
jgi:sortase A